MSVNPLIDARIRELQSGAAKRAAKRAEEQAKREARRREEESQTLSPNDILRQQQAAANWAYWCRIHDEQREQERREEIRQANPILITLKSEFMQTATTPDRRAAILNEFVELYRKAYGRVVDLEALQTEWVSEFRREQRQRVYR